MFIGGESSLCDGTVVCFSRSDLGSMCFFFFQAEDGIRDWSVTGVQTCALPISPHLYSRTALHGEALGRELAAADVVVDRKSVRVGKGVDLGGRRIIKKKKITIQRGKNKENDRYREMKQR